jgi:hypothetical protein
VSRISVLVASNLYQQEVKIMSLKSPQNLDIEEIKFISALGWLATLSSSLASLAVFAAPIA